MKILTLDLSTKSSGWALFNQKNNLQSYGCITDSSKNVIKRIIKMRDELSSIIKNNQINKIIMEEVRPQYNSHTNKVLMWLQAAIVIAAYEINPKIQCEFIATTTWRAAIGIKQGRGMTRDKLKPQDIQYVQNKYNIDVNDDQADAICIFDAYIQKNNNQINFQ